MFERFDDGAHKVMGLSCREARRFQHDHIGTEHLLLALVREGSGLACGVLQNLTVDPKKVGAEVELLVGSGDRDLMGQLPFTRGAKKTLELALEEASALGHVYVGTEHLLLGLLREGEGLAAQVLHKLGVRLEHVRQEVRELVRADPDANLPRTS